jgi:hypothetical protein
VVSSGSVDLEVEVSEERRRWSGRWKRNSIEREECGVLSRRHDWRNRPRLTSSLIPIHNRLQIPDSRSRIRPPPLAKPKMPSALAEAIPVVAHQEEDDA